MKKKWQKVTLINNIVCAVLLVALFGTMFIPFWDYTAKERVDFKICKECEYIYEGKTLPDEFSCPECGAGKKSFKSSTKYEEYAENASVMEFTWMAFDHDDLVKEFEKQDYQINDIVSMPFIVTICVIVGVIMCIFNNKGTWQSLLPTIAGVLSAVTYLTNPLYQLNSNWVIPFGVSCALAVAGLLLLAQWLVSVFRWFIVPVPKH